MLDDRSTVPGFRGYAVNLLSLDPGQARQLRELFFFFLRDTMVFDTTSQMTDYAERMGTVCYAFRISSLTAYCFFVAAQGFAIPPAVALDGGKYSGDGFQQRGRVSNPDATFAGVPVHERPRLRELQNQIDALDRRTHAQQSLAELDERYRTISALADRYDDVRFTCGALTLDIASGRPLVRCRSKRRRSSVSWQSSTSSAGRYLVYRRPRSTLMPDPRHGSGPRMPRARTRDVRWAELTALLQVREATQGSKR